MSLVAKLPNELFMNVLELFFEDCASSCGSTSLEGKPLWNDVKHTLSASHSLRTIGLGLWFYRLIVKNERDWDFVSRMPQIYEWVREISYYNDTAILIPSIDPRKFPALKSVSIRMLDAKHPQTTINRLPTSLHSLEIWKFDTLVVHDDFFSAIAMQLPQLQELRIHGILEGDRFGVGTLFESTDQSIASSLGRLQSLRSLSIDVYLTPATVVLWHASCLSGRSFGSCERCVQQYSAITRRNELDVSLRIANTLSKLDVIEWCSCFSPGEKTVLYVKRSQDGKVSMTATKEDISWKDWTFPVT